MFSNMHLAQSEVSLYLITDTKGDLIAKYPNLTPDKLAADKDFFQTAIKGKTFVSDRLTGEITGLESILIAEPYYDKQGQIAGVVGVSILLSELQKKMAIQVGTRPKSTSSLPVMHW